ncbi:MAG: LysR substrate-binding domain-containing protein, partial [Rubripirellula sp.]
LLALVRAGAGITLLPRQAVPAEENALKFLPIIDCKAERNVYVVSKPNRLLLPAARAFLAKIDGMKLSIT